MSTAIVIGNMVRGFRVISGFFDEDAANNWIGDNRREVGSEYRLAPELHVDALPTRIEEGNAPLKWDPAQTGEAVDPNTGLATDTRTKEERDADLQVDRPDRVRAQEVGLGNSRADPELFGLHSVGSASDRSATIEGTVGGAAEGGSGAAGEGDLVSIADILKDAETANE